MTVAVEGVVKRSVSIAGHRTSISLEAAFWSALGQLARQRGVSVQKMVESIDRDRAGSNLSSAIRMHVLAAARAGELPEPSAAQPPG